ncbi:hypothetical protein Q604_UNBC03778G0001, partial [human gut metagenome]
EEYYTQRVGHEHAQQGRDDHQAQDRPAGRAGEGPDEDGGEVLVQVVLLCAVGNEETAQKQDDDRGITRGGVPERPKGADCKSAVIDFEGSNPSPTTITFQKSVNSQTNPQLNILPKRG